MNHHLSARIASVVLDVFDTLPYKCKPRLHPDGKREWTPLSGIVVELDQGNNDSVLKCVSLATGTKCLPSTVIKHCNGLVLHDCHAEVLACRGFNYWVLDEIHHTLADPAYRSAYIELADSACDISSMNISSETISSSKVPPFQFSSNVSIHLFSTTAPCGDASMELLITSKKIEDALPWAEASLLSDTRPGQPPLGRGHFHLLGVMRRKPARADADATLSKSCTDKIALKQVTGLVCFPANLLVRKTPQTFLRGFVVYPEQYDKVGYDRAFSEEGRLRCLPESEDVQGRFFDVGVLPDTARPFEFGRASDGSSKATNLSALWIAGYSGKEDTVEVIVNGVKQGSKQFDPKTRKASRVSRWNMIKKFTDICRTMQELGHEEGQQLLVASKGKTYNQFKSDMHQTRDSAVKRQVSDKLGGWQSNSADDDFLLSA